MDILQNKELIGIKRYKFTFNDIIDKGGFGIVYKALDLNTNEYVALKQIYFKNEEEKSIIINEINLMMSINSYYSVKLINKFMDDKFYYIIIELCDDNLYNYVKNNGKLKIEILKNIINLLIFI